MRARTLRALAALLHYPDAELRAAIPDIRTVLSEEGMLRAKDVRRIEPLLLQLAGGDLLSAQEHYVEIFDRGRNHSLHLFEHVHGESRDRGQAMVDLRQRYVDAGLEPSSNELPDYLPLFLEYCSTLPRGTAVDTLAEPGVIIALLAERLAARGTPYAGVMAVLADMAGAQAPEDQAVAEDPDDLAALDAAWAEEEVRFGAMAPAAPDAADCPKVQDMVARMRDIAEPQVERSH
ncbi:MAG: nitrate reductase molybdenum cofactor assembly chaperone [Sphingomonadaceae bacterium]|nr:nitrate reductase molybdenum cofactor assembly chaperone [Sphingomonadaceae bacterium]